MKGLLKKILAVSLCAALIGGTAISLPVFVPDSSMTADAAYTSGDYEYTVSNNEATITKYKGSGGNVIIPSKIGRYPVKYIGDQAFSECKSLTSVTIPDSVTSIGDYAFFMCFNLNDITIPNSVESIGDSAFRVCLSLTDVTIPNSVESIGDSAFYNCSSLAHINISNSVKSIGKSAFFVCRALTDIIIPSSVTSIGAYAFGECSSLTHITISRKLTSIEDHLFSSCISLTSITIPSSVKNISDHAFYDCSSLTNVTIPSGVTSIDDYAFYHCMNLKKVTISPSVTNIGNHAFGYYTNDEHYIEKMPGFTIYSEKGTAAEKYANDNGFEFIVELENTSVINSNKVQIGDKVRVSASANGGTSPYKYAYYYKRSSNNSWKTLGTEFGTNSSVAFAPTAEACYDVKVIVKDSTGNTAEKLFTVIVVEELELTNVSVVGREKINLGTAIPMIGKAVGGSAPYTYSFYFKRSTNTNWKLLGDKFQTTASARFKPTATGTYDIRIDVKDSSGTVVKKFFTATAK